MSMKSKGGINPAELSKPVPRTDPARNMAKISALKLARSKIKEFSPFSKLIVHTIKTCRRQGGARVQIGRRAESTEGLKSKRLISIGELAHD